MSPAKKKPTYPRLVHVRFPDGSEEPAAPAHRKDMVEVGSSGMFVDTDEVIEIDGVRRRITAFEKSFRPMRDGSRQTDFANQITHKPAD